MKRKDHFRKPLYVKVGKSSDNQRWDKRIRDQALPCIAYKLGDGLILGPAQWKITIT